MRRKLVGQMVIAGGWSARPSRHFRAFRPWWRFGAWLALQHYASGAHLTETPDVPEQPSGASSRDQTVQMLSDFEAFFRRHERELFGYFWRMTGDEQTAYDLSQETFVRAWQRFETIAHYDRPGAWLFRVATNLALTHQKRTLAPVGAAQPFAAGFDPAVSDPAWRLAVGDAVRATLLALPSQQRAALVLREVYGFSCAEVAEALGITLAAAKMTLSRGREAFRTRYARQESQEEQP